MSMGYAHGDMSGGSGDMSLHTMGMGENRVEFGRVASKAEKERT